MKKITVLLVFGLIILTSGCKYINQQNNTIKSLEKNGVEIPDELKQQKGFNAVDVLFPLGGILIFGLFVLRGIKQFKSKKAEFGFALGDINEKINSIKNNPEILDKMSDEEKKNLDNMMNFLNKGTNNN